MPSDLTVFAASTLIYIDIVLTAVIALGLLYLKPRQTAVWWGVAVAVTLVLSGLGAVVGAALYNDPRPFTVDHVKPLISHAADNGFPSDHALMAALFVAAILFLSIRWALPVALLGALVDWARVGAGIHHVEDVLGSSLIVGIAMAIALFLAEPLTDLLLPHVPDSLLRLGVRGSGAHPISSPRR